MKNSDLNAHSFGKALLRLYIETKPKQSYETEKGDTSLFIGSKGTCWFYVEGFQILLSGHGCLEEFMWRGDALAMCHSSTLKGSLLNTTAVSLLFQELLSVETVLSDSAI